MLKVLYDFQKFQFKQIGGIPRYFRSLINEFEGEKRLSAKVFCPHQNTPPKSNPTLFTKTKWYFHQQVTQTKNINAFKKHLKINPIDLIHPTYYDPYVTQLNLPYILTVFDLTHEFYPRLFSFYDLTRRNKRKVIKKATKIIAISHNTKKDLVKYYHLDPDRIVVIPLASSLDPKKIQPIPLPKNFLLFVGARYAYKNFSRLLRAVSSIIKKDSSLYLVCVGGGLFSDQEQALLLNLEISDHVIHINPCDEELSYCYTRAQALIYPSLYEGFGLPIIEAFACNCPVILSNTSCHPEVAGQAGIYFDPLSVKSIRQTITKFLKNPSKRNLAIKQGRVIAKHYSWKQTAKLTNELYQSIV
jgi:glycosyltransferase involved in cell wall biosynthesis